MFWLGVVAALLLVGHRETTVAACRDLVRATRPLAAYFVLYGIWIGVVAWLGTRLGLWDRTLLKETVLWTVLSGLGLLAGTTAAMKRSGWFRKTVLATVGATAVLEFVVNAKSFPLVVELLLQPVVFLAIVLPMVARDPEHRPVRSLAGWVAALVGFAALGWTEFAETRRALQWLATCHMGHYRHHERYRSDLLPIVESQLVRDGLSEDHGIVMNVAVDGQSWYAYRETVSGWYFAIGASGPPPDQWCYDGPQPPEGFPDHDSWSRFGVGEFARHW